MSERYRKALAGKLVGQGLDIGPLHKPMWINRKKAAVDYVDRLPASELVKQYPELAHLPLVDADILDDAETLSKIPDGIYDFVISSHVIEHMRNPILALRSWWNVLEPGGLLYLVVPDKRKIFDHRRPRTPLDHVCFDYFQPEHARRERDFAHFLEYAELVDGKTGPDILAHAKHLVDIDYSIHFHCWIPEDMTALLEYFSSTHKPFIIRHGPLIDPADDHEMHFLLEKPR